MTDQEGLIPRLKYGEEKAFRELVEQYQSKVYRLARSMVMDHDIADEVAQQTFIQVYRKIGTFAGRSSLSTWIYRITVNLAKNQLRGLSRQVGLERVDRLTDRSEPTDRALEQHQKWQEVLSAAEQLPEKQREVLNLRAVQGLSYKEIAAIVGGKSGSAKVNYHLAVKKLREKLGKKSDEN